MLQSQYQAGVRLSFGFSRSRRGTLIQDSMRLMMLFNNFSYSGKYPQLPASHYCWIYYLCTDEQLVRCNALGVGLLPAQGPPEREAIPKGKHLRKDCHPERKVSPNGLPSRKESISEWTAIPKGKYLRNDCQPERKRISERTAIPKGNASPGE